MADRKVGVSAVEIEIEIVRRQRSAALRAETETEVRIEQVVGRSRVRIVRLELEAIAEALLRRQYHAVILSVVERAVGPLERTAVGRDRRHHGARAEVEIRDA